MKRPNLTRKLVLEDGVRIPDNAGGYAETWQPLGTIWADVHAGTGRERGGAAATLSYVPYRVVLRASPVGSPRRPKPGQRFVEGSRIYRIEAVSDFDPGGLFLKCFTKEEVLS